MGLDIASAEARNVSPRQRVARASRAGDPVELALLGLFAVLSLWTVALDLWQVVIHGRLWTGTDGFYITDQMQYLAWIRGSSHHLLASNLFVLTDTPADYFQPAIVLSAGLVALGMAPWLALLVWKPVAVGVTFVAYRAYIQRSLPGVRARRTALTLALFFASFTVVYGIWSVVGDLTPVFLSWGYTFGLVAMALMVLALLVYERTRERERASWVPGALGALATLLHPWQGELLVVILLGSELGLWLLTRRPARLLGTPAMTLGLVAVPILYYLILGRADESWKLARVASKHGFSLWTLLLAVAPLLVPAVVAWRPRRTTYIDVATRVWLLAALAIWALSASALSATPLHAFQGITLPLAVLAVEGVQRVRLPARMSSPAAIIAALALLTVPATVELMHLAAETVAPTSNNPNFISREEQRALHYLADDHAMGGVLARMYLGTVVPALTDRRTFVGDCLWSEPLCYTRIAAVQNLFAGQLPVATARAFVRATQARFVLTDCQQPADLERVLAPMLVSVHRFGCASVYEIDPPALPPALSESALDAALRAAGRQ